MKIVHVCLNSSVFGKNYAYQDNLLSKAHKKLGHEVSIVAPVYSEYDQKTGKIICENPGEEIIDNDIRLIRLKPALPYKLNHSIHLFVGLKNVLEKLDPDLIFVHGVTSFNYRYFYTYKKKKPHTKIVFDNHADFNNSCQSKIPYLYAKYIVRCLVVKKIKDAAERFYGVTPARCDFLRDMYHAPSDKIDLLPMGADDEEMHFENKESIREIVRKQYGIEEDDFLIVTGGKIDPLKNIHILAEAVARSRFQHIKMLIFGSIREDLAETFARLKSERIQCVGWLPSNEVYRYFYAADLVAFPGLHSVLWEQAVASQVPCAFSLIKGFEHVDIGGNCVLMEGKTADYYQALVEKLYNDKAFYAALLDKAKSEESKKFLYSTIAEKVIKDVAN